MSNATCAIVSIKTEANIEEFMSLVRQGNTVGYQLDINIEREEHFRLMNLINEQYKMMFANTNNKSARVA